MKLSSILIVMLITVFAHANDLLDVQKDCNNGHSKTGDYAQPAIAESSCILTAMRIAPGFDIPQKNDNRPTLFFFDTFVYMKLNDKDIPIRFLVYEDEKDYNTIQAIVQTAYATRANVSIIFANPNIADNLYEYETFLTKRKTENKCFVNKDLKGNVAFINCKIQTIQLSSN